MSANQESRTALFERAVSEFGPRIRAGVRSFIRNPEDAEDVISEIKAALWISLGTFDRRSSLGTFVFAVSRHKMISYLREKYRDAAIIRKSAETLDGPQRGPQPVDPAAIKVGFLTPGERTVLRLMATGATNKEIAQALFVTVNTVKTHAKRIHAKLGSKNRVEAAAVYSRCAGK